MTTRRKKYYRQFKLDIIAQPVSGKISQVQIARENGIHPSMITRWQKEHAADSHNAFGGNGNICKREARLAHLERQLARARAETDLLRHANELLMARLRDERPEGSEGDVPSFPTPPLRFPIHCGSSTPYTLNQCMLRDRIGDPE